MYIEADNIEIQGSNGLRRWQVICVAAQYCEQAMRGLLHVRLCHCFTPLPLPYPSSSPLCHTPTLMRRESTSQPMFIAT